MSPSIRVVMLTDLVQATTVVLMGSWVQCSAVQCRAVQGVQAPVCMRVNFLELVLSFYHVGPSDQTQMVRLGSEHFYPLSHLIVPSFKNFLSAPYPLFWPYITSQLKPFSCSQPS